MKVWKVYYQEDGVLFQHGSDTDCVIVLVNEFRNPRLLLS